MDSPLSRRPPATSPIRSLRPQPGARRLYCFPCAGAGASMYRPWADALAAYDIEVVGVQPPGREERLAEPPFTDVHPLADALVDALPAWLDRPYAFFGHSLGALVAFEVAKRLPLRGLPPPQALFVSARRAPQLPLSQRPMHAMPRELFIEELRILGGTPRAVLEERELMAMFEPMLRADLEMTETYRPAEAGRVPLPIVALAGADDPRVYVPEVEAWGAATTAGFELHVLGGGHFFIQSRLHEVLEIIHTRVC